MSDYGDFSYTQRVVILKDWWIIKCSQESDGKRFGVSGYEISTFMETRAVRGVFTSSPIIKAFDAFTLEPSDGICIILRGFFNKERAVECGFLPEISRDIIFGFPPCWEQICNKYFIGVSSASDKASCSSIVSPRKNTKENLEDFPSETECRDKSTVAAKSKRKVDASKNPCTNGADHGSNVLDNAVEKEDSILPDRIEKVTSKNATKETLTSEKRKGKHKVRETTLGALSKGIKSCRTPGKRGESKKSKKAIKSYMRVEEQPMNRSGPRVKQEEKSLTGEKTNRKIDFDVKATPVTTKAKKEKTENPVSTDSIGQKRSRSGRLLVSPLEFWRNQIPVYDLERNLTQVKEGHGSSLTPSKVKKSGIATAKKIKK
ncbi:unnamed protein product [Cochlearia groenlandica]